MLLLHRHGIVTREVMTLESLNMPWSEIQFALRRLEYGGTIRRGWFVHSLSGEQYALPEAVEMLRAMRGANPAREKPVAMSAIDPANPYGAILKGCGVAREATNVVVIRGGRLILALAGHAILTVSSIDKDAEPLDDESFSAAAAALMTTRGEAPHRHRSTKCRRWNPRALGCSPRCDFIPMAARWFTMACRAPRRCARVPATLRIGSDRLIPTAVALLLR